MYFDHIETSKETSCQITIFGGKLSTYTSTTITIYSVRYISKLGGLEKCFQQHIHAVSIIFDNSEHGPDFRLDSTTKLTFVLAAPLTQCQSISSAHSLFNRQVNPPANTLYYIQALVMGKRDYIQIMVIVGCWELAAVVCPLYVLSLAGWSPIQRVTV